jgi:oligopeptide transport system substrate-binding protein
MRGSIRSGAALVLSVSFIAVACASPPVRSIEGWDPDGEITTPLQRIPVRIDPQIWSDTDRARHSAMVFEALMTFDPKTLRPIPAAAKDHPKISDDGLTYTFTLRDGSTYSDGTALTAKDFVYAFSRLCDPTVRAVPQFHMRIILVGCNALGMMDPKRATPEELAAARAALGLRANGDREFAVHLTQPASYFAALAATPLGYPVRELDVIKSGPAYGADPATLIGNGPFKLVQKTDQKLVFERNDRYRTPAKLKRWTKVLVERDVAFAAYRNNEIDLYGGIPSGRAVSVVENFAAIEADADLRAQVVEVRGAYTDYFMLNPSRPPFSDRSVRQAFARAFDRVSQLRELTKLGEAAYSLIPPGLPGHDAADRSQAFDLAQAKELLRSSGFSGGSELSSVRITCPKGDPGCRTPAEWLQQDLKRNLGVEIAIEFVDDATLERMYATPRTAPQIRFGRWGVGAIPDPQNWLSTIFHSSAPIASSVGYRNVEFDALVTEADRERDPQRRAQLYQRASRLLSEDAPAIWSWWPSNRYLRKPRVKGVTDSVIDFEYGILRTGEVYVTKKT